MINNIFVSKNICSHLPVLIIGLDYNAVNEWSLQRYINIVSNIQSLSNIKFISADDSFYSYSFPKIRDWFNNLDGFIDDIKNILGNNRYLQLVGDYKELCIVSVAKLLKENGYEPIIIDNDLYSISAIASVEEGDTLENRIIEEGFSVEEIYFNGLQTL